MGFIFLELHLEEPSICAVAEDTKHATEALPHTSPSLLSVLEEAEGDTVVESATGEVCQPPSHGDSLSAVGGQFLMRPCRCCACAWQQSWAVFGFFLQPLKADA